MNIMIPPALNVDVFWTGVTWLTADNSSQVPLFSIINDLCFTTVLSTTGNNEFYLVFPVDMTL